MALMDKPLALKKVHSFVRRLKKQQGKINKLPRAITLNYNNVCNFKCNFCFSAEESNEHLHDCLSFEEIHRLADEADALGIWEIVLTGGELLVQPEKLFQLIASFQPERFQMVLITNGYLMTPALAEQLKSAGIDCVGVSISGMSPEEHNASRGGVKDAHKRALDALAYVKAAGMAAWPNVIFGHHNARSRDLRALLEYCDQKGYSTYFMLAMPFGTWKDNRLDAEDSKIFAQLRKEYHCCFDTWDMYDPQKEKLSGCWTVNRTYITPLGDVLVCPYINISIGNIKERSLKEILDYGFKIKYFGSYSPVCISAQHPFFRRRFLPNELNIFHPVKAQDVFGKEDFLEDEQDEQGKI